MGRGEHQEGRSSVDFKNTQETSRQHMLGEWVLSGLGMTEQRCSSAPFSLRFSCLMHAWCAWKHRNNKFFDNVPPNQEFMAD